MIDEQAGSEAGRNSAVSLRSYLDDVGAAVRRVPSAWVKCELHVLKPGDKFVRMEFIELDRSGRQVAKVNGGCFPGEWRRIAAEFDRAGLPLEAGSQVLVKLEAHMNAVYGFQVNVLDVDVTFALGDLSARMQSIRKNLRDEGLWGLNRRLDHPTDFTRVAVISPAGAAGLGDFRSSADRLDDCGLVRFDYYEAPFQTRDAPARIVEILRRLYRSATHDSTRLCAIAIIRGGGASADLAWLVDQKLTEAVCRMNVPVMTGIGHERDRNLLDEVACIPCDTPSKVVEHITRTVTQAAIAGRRAYETIVSLSGQVVERAHAGLVTAKHAIERDMGESLRLAEGMVQDTSSALRPDARRLLEDTRMSLDRTAEAVRNGARGQREEAATSISSIRSRIASDVSTALHQVDLGTGRALGEIAIRVEGVPQIALDELRMTHEQIVNDAGRVLDDCARDIAMIAERADALSPRTVLAAGYAILRDLEGVPLTSMHSVGASPHVHAEMRDGRIVLSPQADPPVASMTKPKPAPRARKTTTTRPPAAKTEGAARQARKKTNERSDDQGA